MAFHDQTGLGTLKVLAAATTQDPAGRTQNSGLPPANLNSELQNAHF
jgi:hypothetical protein